MRTFLGVFLGTWAIGYALPNLTRWRLAALVAGVVLVTWGALH